MAQTNTLSITRRIRDVAPKVGRRTIGNRSSVSLDREKAQAERAKEVRRMLATRNPDKSPKSPSQILADNSAILRYTCEPGYAQERRIILQYLHGTVRRVVQKSIAKVRGTSAVRKQLAYARQEAHGDKDTLNALLAVAERDRATSLGIREDRVNPKANQYKFAKDSGGAKGMLHREVIPKQYAPATRHDHLRDVDETDVVDNAIGDALAEVWSRCVTDADWTAEVFAVRGIVGIVAGLAYNGVTQYLRRTKYDHKGLSDDLAFGAITKDAEGHSYKAHVPFVRSEASRLEDIMQVVKATLPRDAKPAVTRRILALVATIYNGGEGKDLYETDDEGRATGAAMTRLSRDMAILRACAPKSTDLRHMLYATN